MPKDETYNGWRNYETWCVHLWLTNDEATYNYWRESAETCRDENDDTSALRNAHPVWTAEEAAKFALADLLKDELADEATQLMMKADAVSSLWSDLLTSALAKVDYAEIAAAFLET